MESELHLINDASYLHIQEGWDAFDYALYDKETMRKIDSGQIVLPEMADNPATENFAAARSQVFDDCRIAVVKIEKVPIDFLYKLQAAQLEPPLDEYPMPDASLTMADIANIGYLQGDLLPVTFERAKELAQKGVPLCEVTWLGTVQAVSGELSQRQANSTLAVAREAWENSPMFQAAVAGRMNHQAERELAFRAHQGDCFAIYQLNHSDPEMRFLRYESLESLQKQGKTPQHENYELVYTAPFTEKMGLNALWDKFNTDPPPDYRHPSMSVSDVVAVKTDGETRCFYVDRFDYVEISDFLARPMPQKEQNITIAVKPRQQEELYSDVNELNQLRQQLTDRLTENFSDYKSSLLLKGKQELIDDAKHIADTATVYHYMMQRNYDKDELRYFLQFQSPLEVVASYWTDAEVSPDALDSVIADIADRQDDLSLFPLITDGKEAEAQRPEQESEPSKKLSIKEQLAAKPVHSDKPATKPKDQEVR